MKNSIYAAALLISGTILLCADAGFFSFIGIGLMVLSLLMYFWKNIKSYFALYFPSDESEKTTDNKKS